MFKFNAIDDKNKSFDNSLIVAKLPEEKMQLIVGGVREGGCNKYKPKDIVAELKNKGKEQNS